MGNRIFGITRCKFYRPWHVFSVYR